MNTVARIEPRPTGRAHLNLFNPSASECHAARWLINGYQARIVIWTAEEYEQLSERPTDARYYPCGVWCALRVD